MGTGVRVKRLGPRSPGQAFGNGFVGFFLFRSLWVATVADDTAVHVPVTLSVLFDELHHGKRVGYNVHDSAMAVLGGASCCYSPIWKTKTQDQ